MKMFSMKNCVFRLASCIGIITKQNRRHNHLYITYEAAYFWFSKVHTHVKTQAYALAQAYANIAKFHQTITLRMEEVEDAGMYQMCYQDMEHLYQQHQMKAPAEIVCWKVIVCLSVY